MARDEQKINELLEERNRLEAEYGEMLEKSQGRSKEAIKNRNSRLKLDAAITSEQSKQSAIEEKRSKTNKSIDKTLAAAAKKQRQIKVTAKDTFGMSAKINKAAQKELEITQKGVAAGQIGNNLALKLNDIGEDLISQNYDLDGLKASHRDLDEELASLGAEATEEEKEAIKAKQQLLKLESTRLKTEALKNQALKEADNLTGGAASKVSGMVGQAMKMGPAFAAAGAAVAIVGGAIGFAVKALKFAAEQIDILGQSFGTVGTETGEFKDTLLDASVEVISIGKATKDVVEVTQELSQNFGLSLNEAAKLSDKILDSAVGMGLNNSEAAKLFGTLMVMGDLSAQQAERFAENTYQLAAQNGVAPVAVLRDMANSSEMIAEFGSHNLESLTSAAIQARKMGLNLQTVSKISNSLLDFQSSIQNEMEASAIIGRRINLNEARRLAFAGDTEGAFKAVIKQMGGIDKFEKLGILQRRALAKSIGLEATELSKLVKQQDEQVEKQKTFNDIMGEDGLSSLTSLINKVTELGKTFLMEFGEPLEQYLGDFADKYFNEEAMESIKERIKEVANSVIEFGKSLSSSFQTLKDIATGAMMGASIGFMFGGIGAGPGALIGAALGGLGLLNLFRGEQAEEKPVNDFSSKGGSHLVVRPNGQVLRTNPKDTVFGTTAVNDFQSGPAGSMANNQLLTEMRENNRQLTNLITAVNDNNSNREIRKLADKQQGLIDTVRKTGRDQVDAIVFG